MEFNHTSVLLNETIEELHIKPDGIYVDGTLGGGGHAYEVCKRLGEQGRFIGIDQDADAICAAGKRLAEFQDKVTIVRSNYSNMKQVLSELGITKVDGIVLDLGVSSFQLDTPERGFTYRVENAHQRLWGGSLCKKYCKAHCCGTRKESHRDNRTAKCDYSWSNTKESSDYRRTSFQENLSGTSY